MRCESKQHASGHFDGSGQRYQHGVVNACGAMDVWRTTLSAEVGKIVLVHAKDINPEEVVSVRILVVALQNGHELGVWACPT